MDTPEFENIIEQFYQPLFKFAMSLTRNEHDALDLTQDLFVRYAQKGHQIREETKVKSWMFTTMHRMFIGEIRRNKRKKEQPLHLLDAQELPMTNPEAHAKTSANEMVQELNGLEDTFRLPLTLFYLRQHTYEEISEILNIPMGTVMSRLSRGRKQLRQRISEKKRVAE